MLPTLLVVVSLVAPGSGDAPRPEATPDWSENPVFLELDDEEQIRFARELISQLAAEGRDLEALPLSAFLLRKVLADPAVAGPLHRIEASVRDDLEAGATDRAADRFLLYRAALASDPWLSLAAARLGGELAGRLVEAAEAEREKGEVTRAIALYEEAALFDPGSRDVEAGLHRLTRPPASPEPRDTWTSPLDRKTMVWVPAGRFIMGCTTADKDCDDDERRIQRKSVRGFWMDATEVTNQEYLRCVDAGACTAPSDEIHRMPEYAGNPVTSVSWYQARDYAQWSRKRLPTETEWEFAARGPVTDSRYPWGQEYGRKWANASGSGGEDQWNGVAPVAQFPGSSFGLFDLAGNVWEWCADSYHENFQDCPTDGSPCPDSGSSRVLRGGSGFEPPENLRVSKRFRDEPERYNTDVGFRCVMDGE